MVKRELSDTRPVGFCGIFIMFCIFSFSFLILSCNNAIQESSAPKPYFDLTSFFNMQMSQLNKDSLIVLKTSAINGETDEHEMDWTDWKREFALFYESDINKPSLIGKYSADTLHSIDSGETRIRYAANDSSLRTRLIEVTISDHSVKEIHVINHSSGFLSSSSENLIYQPMDVYVIKTETKNKFFGANDFSVMGKITSKDRKYF